MIARVGVTFLYKNMDLLKSAPPPEGLRELCRPFWKVEGRLSSTSLTFLTDWIFFKMHLSLKSLRKRIFKDVKCPISRDCCSMQCNTSVLPLYLAD